MTALEARDAEPHTTQTVSAVSPEEWMTSKQACRYLGVSPGTLYKLIREGQLRAHRSGRLIRIRREDADAFIDRVRVKPGELEHLSLHPRRAPGRR